MADKSQEDGSRRRRSRVVLLAIFLVFAAPATAAWLWFHFGSGFSARNYGTLYDPARPIVGIGFETAQQDVAGFDDVRGTWLLVYLGSAACAEECLVQLDKMNRVRLSQAKNVKRVRALYLAPVRHDRSVAEQIRVVMPEGLSAYIDDTSRESLVRLLVHQGEGASDVVDRIYLVDPIGNAVLSYEADADPAQMRKDLARLLRASQIG